MRRIPFRTAVLAVSAAAATGIVAPVGVAHASPVWGACPTIHRASADTVCTTIGVPRDYARPAAGTITITVSKLPARDQAGRRGVLVGNPGGPGGDAISMFSQISVPDEVRDDYDLVAVQPRGLIDAHPVECAPSSPTSAASILAGGAVRRSTCDARTPGGTAFVTTEATARDIDSARAQLGLGNAVDLLGVSYGTTLMSTFATLFPQHTGRLVLDSAVDPTVVWNTLLSTNADGRRQRTEALFDWIAQNDAVYHLGRTPLAVYREWSRKVVAEAGVPPTLEPPRVRIGDTPLALDNAFDAYIAGRTSPATRTYFDNLVASVRTGRMQNASNLLTTTRGGSASRDQWPSIARQIIAAPQPAPPVPQELRAYAANAEIMPLVLFCNENAVPARPAVAPASLLDTLVTGDPYAGPGYLFESGLLCSGAPPVARPVSIRNRGLAVAPLMIQSLGDPQTPYRGALIHRDRMHARLLTVGGGDHVQFGRGNPVVDAAIVEYLRTGTTSITSAPQAPITTPLLPPR